MNPASLPETVSGEATKVEGMPGDSTTRTSWIADQGGGARRHTRCVCTFEVGTVTCMTISLSPRN